MEAETRGRLGFIGGGGIDEAVAVVVALGPTTTRASPAPRSLGNRAHVSAP